MTHKPTYEELRQKVAKLELTSETALQEKTRALNERVKELNCLYRISSLGQQPNQSLDDLFQHIVNLLPSSWQYPEFTCARILLGEKEYKTENFKDTEWKQVSGILADGKKEGTLEVCCLAEKPPCDGMPFLKEEGRLLDAVAEGLGRIVERLHMIEERKLLAQIQHAEKMQAIATLAGGVAHEYNNALAVIMGTIELIMMDSLIMRTERVKYLESMRSAGDRMARLTKQLLAYARGGKYLLKDLSLADFVTETMSALRHQIHPGIRVETSFPEGLSAIRADHAQMQMVLSAVMANASEAIADNGLITITAENRYVDNGGLTDRPDVKAGKYVCLSIADDGRGMNEEEKARIFEPFFTTKFQGRGMGMAAAYGIVKNHGGWISVDSEISRGTVVQICLPAASKPSEKVA